MLRWWSWSDVLPSEVDARPPAFLAAAVARETGAGVTLGRTVQQPAGRGFRVHLTQLADRDTRVDVDRLKANSLQKSLKRADTVGFASRPYLVYNCQMFHAKEPPMSTMLDALLATAPDVCGGRICIRGTRITVHRIASLYKQGLSAEDIIPTYPHLFLCQVYAALAFYHANRVEIDSELAAADAAYDELKHQV